MEQHYKQVEKSNKMLKTLLAFNRTITNYKNEKELVQEVCRVSVEDLGHSFAWFGYAHNDDAKSITHFISHGNGIDFEEIELTWEDNEQGNHPAGIAIRTCGTVFTLDNREEDHFKIWKEKVLQKCFLSSIALPIMNTTHTLGVLCICSNEVNKFSSVEEISILEELAKDLSRGIHHLRSNKQTELGNKKLNLDENWFHSVFRNSSVAMGITSFEGMKLAVNDAFSQMLGYKEEELLKMSLYDYTHPEDTAINREHINKLISGEHKKLNYQKRYIHKSGKTVWADVSAFILKDHENKPLHIAGIIKDITLHKTLEEERKKSEEQFKNIFLSSGVSMGITSVEGNLLHVNGAFCKAMGYSENELTKMNIWELIHPEDRVMDELEFQKMIMGEKSSINFQKRYVNKSGNIHWADISLGLLKNSYDSTPSLAFVAQDITEQKKYEEKLIRREAQYRKFFEEDLAGDFISTKEGKILMCNNAFAKILGYNSSEELINRNANEFYYDDSQRESFINQLTAKGKLQQHEVTLKRVDGRKAIVLENVVGVFNSKKELKEIIGYAFDITDKKEADKRIQLLSSAVEQSPVSIVITDLLGNIQYVNQKFVDLTGYTIEEVFGKKSNILKTGHTSKEEYEQLWKTILSGNHWYGEFLNKKKNGELYWESAMIIPIKNESGMPAHFVGIKEDITERKKIIGELVQAKENAEHSDKLKSEFLAQMSHEVRTPINIVLSYTSFVSDELNWKSQLTPDIENAFESINNACQRIIRTMELIINMSEVQARTYKNNPQSVDIYTDVIEHLYHHYNAEVKSKNLQMVILKNTDETKINVDPYSFEQIFSNLLENAIKFTQKGGITITVDRNEKSKLCVNIEDTGIGISDNYLEKIFTPFTQEEQGYTRSFDGNGLGLALTKKLCDLNGIEIKIQSKKKYGTNVTLIFP